MSRESIQPVVLVGGRSRRFGRDKLREHFQGGLLVERPIAARAVFGLRVKLVGECDESVGRLADGVLQDEYPGVGPIGGVVSALRAWRGPVFVLAGDMPEFSAGHVELVLGAALRSPEAWAVLAHTGSLEPLAGLYRPEALGALLPRLVSDDRSLMNAIPPHCRVEVSMPDPRAGTNVNTPEDLRGCSR